MKDVSIRQKLGKEEIAGQILTLPFALGFLLFTLIPMAMSLYYSFTDYNILSKPAFIGLGNYITMFTKDARFWKALTVTFQYAFLSVPLRLVFALMVAMLLVRGGIMNAIYRAVYYLPSIIGGTVAVSILWRRMFATDGTINILISSFLRQFGSETTFGFPWLGDTRTAIWVLVLMSVWQFGSSMLIFLAAIKQIPSSYYEAAEVDGANRNKKFWSITLPLLTPTIFFNLVMQTISGFLAFTQSYIITQGKPLDSTLFYAVYMYEQSFTNRAMGYSSAMAWVMLLLIGIMTLIIFKTKHFWVIDEGDS